MSSPKDILDKRIQTLLQNAAHNWNFKTDIAEESKLAFPQKKEELVQLSKEIIDRIKNKNEFRSKNPKRKKKEPLVHYNFDVIIEETCRFLKDFQPFVGFQVIMIHDETLDTLFDEMEKELFKAKKQRRNLKERQSRAENIKELRKRPDFLITLEGKTDGKGKKWAYMPLLTIELKTDAVQDHLGQISRYLIILATYFNISEFYGLLGDLKKVQYVKYDKTSDKISISKEFKWNLKKTDNTSKI